MRELQIAVESDAMNLDLCLFSGQVFRWVRKENGEYHGIDGEHWYRITPSGSHLDIETNATEADFRNLFNLDSNAKAIERQITRQAPEMATSMLAMRGLRVLQPSDPVETFFSFLCTANNHIKRITPMIAKLADYGHPIEGTPFKRFPRNETIAEIPESELRVKGFGYRGATIPHAAQEAMKRGGDDWIQGLKSVGYQQAHQELIAIKGIGNKLADCICLYGLHYPEAVPIDTHLWQAACRVFFPEHKDKALTDARYRQIGGFFRDRFGKNAGWAHLYLYYENMTRHPNPKPLTPDA